MTQEFDEAVKKAHSLGLKVGPLYQKPDGAWRAYVQKGTDLMRLAEGPTIEVALTAAVVAAAAELLLITPAPSASMADNPPKPGPDWMLA